MEHDKEHDVEELVSHLSLEVIKDVAPDELDLFEDIEEEFFKNPNAFLEKDPEKKEKMLGFIGGGDIEQFTTVAILPLMWGVIAYIGKETIESLKKEGAKAVAKKIEEKLGGKEGKESRTSNEKIKEVRAYIFKNALAMGVNKEKAEGIADSAIGKMFLLGII